MTFKSIFYAGLIATTSLVVSQATVQAASFTAQKSTLPHNQSQLTSPNVIKVHDPYKGKRVRRYYYDPRPNFSADQHSPYSQYDNKRRHYAKHKHAQRTCVIRRDYPNWTETGLNMPPWEWVPC